MLDSISEVLVSRSSLLTVLLVAVILLAVAACDDGGSDSAGKPVRSTTTSSSSTTSTTLGGSTSSTATSVPTASTTVPAETIGTCGNQTDAIVAAIGGSEMGGLNARQGQFSVRRCRIAASSAIWAAADAVPNPGVQLDRATVVLQRIGALWNVENVGTSGVGCEVAPATVVVDLGLIC
jgi:hypothetical protein